MGRGKCVEKIGSVQIFLQEDGTYDGYDFATGKVIVNPYHDKPEGYKPTFIKKSQEDIDKEIEEISDYQTVALPDRKIKEEYLKFYGVKIGVSEDDGVTPTSHFYPYEKDGKIVGYKARIIHNKKMWSIGDIKDCDLFGWSQAIQTGAKRIYITEGELDAVSLFQIFKDTSKGTPYADFSPAVVSLAHGASSAGRDLGKYANELRKRFKEIVLVFDQDDAGKKAADDVVKLLPEALVANLPMKDVNECLMAGKSRAAHAAVQFQAAKPKNTRLVNANDLHEKAKEPPKYGVSWPWKHITEATRGIRTGETIYIGAGQKQGKSEIVNTLTAHFIKEHGWKVFLIKPEEANNKTYKLVAGKLEGKFFHDPTKPFDEAAYDRAGGVLRDHLYMLNLYQSVTWDVIKSDIRAAALEGCKAIILDPITNLTNGMESGAANVKLQEIAQELAAMALDLDVVIFIFCHLRNPDTGVPHEMGGRVLSSQFAGSRAMARSCNLMLGLEGNRDPALPADQRNLRKLVLLEDREFGEAGEYGLYWNRDNGLFHEI